MVLPTTQKNPTTMIIADSTNTIESSNLGNTQTFGMQQTKKSFKLLSSLYSDTPLAIIRELGCNARDSHISADKPNAPFHIHLPNSLEPWVTIEDFGTGISHADIYEIYAVYFCSTKTKSNSQIGCMGLGSKSPFAYTDAFSITSTVDGEQRVYNAYFNENDMPAISLMSSCSTTDSNGVKIQIPVKAGDFAQFAEATKKSFRFFDVKPTISGGKIEWHDEVPTFEGEGWKSFESFGNNECWAIMGGVTYPVDIYKMSYETRTFLQHSGLVMFFEMGELDFVPSREHLDYCEMTMKALNAKIAFAQENFVQRYSAMIADKPNIFEALKAVYISDRKFSFLSSIQKQQGAIWNGIDISSPVTYIRKIAGSATKCFSYANYGRSRYRMSVNEINLKNPWYVDDLARGTDRRVKEYLKNHPEEIITLFTDHGYKALIAAGFPDIFVKASTLPKINYVKSVSGTTKVGFNIYTLGYEYHSSWDSKAYDDSKVPTYYIEKGTGWDFDISSSKIGCTNKASVICLCKYLNIDRMDVVMVGKRGAKVLEEDGSESFEDMIAGLTIAIDAQALATHEHYSSSNINELLKDKDYKALDSNHPVVLFIQEIIEANKITKSIQHISSLLKEDPAAKVKPISFSSADPVLNIIMEDFHSYRWNSDQNPKILLALQEKEKKALTVSQNSATILP